MSNSMLSSDGQWDDLIAQYRAIETSYNDAHENMRQLDQLSRQLALALPPATQATNASASVATAPDDIATAVQRLRRDSDAIAQTQQTISAEEAKIQEIQRRDRNLTVGMVVGGIVLLLILLFAFGII